MEPEEFISQSAWERLSHQEQDAYYERFTESLRELLQGRNSDRALLFADHWDDLASWTRSAWNVMLEKADQLEARLEELATSPELSETSLPAAGRFGSWCGRTNGTFPSQVKSFSLGEKFTSLWRVVLYRRAGTKEP